MQSPIETQAILVAGLGNLLMRDDGIGVHTVYELQKAGRSDILPVEVGTAVLRALHLFEDYKKIIVVDSMKAGNPPGTMYHLTADQIENKNRLFSIHELGLWGMLEFMNVDKMPEIHVVGIEPEIIDYGTELSETLQSKLPEICKLIESIVSDFKPQESII